MIQFFYLFVLHLQYLNFLILKKICSYFVNTFFIIKIITIHLFKWQLNRRLGYLFLSAYVAFLIFASAVELNMFSLVNLPMCVD
jgi:hypothetical protein